MHQFEGGDGPRYGWYPGNLKHAGGIVGVMGLKKDRLSVIVLSRTKLSRHAIALTLTITSFFLSAEPRVFVRDGNIMLSEDAGNVILLTHSGRDFDPWLTREADDVLFVRSDAGDMFRTAVYEVNVNSAVEKLVFFGPIESHGTDISYLGEPSFDIERRTLYVLGKTGVTSGELFAVDLLTKKASFIADAASYAAIVSGSNAGNLLLYQRKISVIGFPYYVYWLYAPNGKDLGIAGPDDLDLASAVHPELSTSLMDVGQGARQRAGIKGNQKAQSVPLSIGRAEMATRLSRYVVPQYPDKARGQRIKGGVELIVHISQTGSVTDVKLLSGHPLLVDAAIAAVKQWTYRPIEVGGKPCAVTTIVDVPFPPK